MASRKRVRKSRVPSKSDNPGAQERPGISLEKVVARIQQMMDPNSTVTHNETLVDRVGNKTALSATIYHSCSQGEQTFGGGLDFLA